MTLPTRKKRTLCVCATLAGALTFAHVSHARSEPRQNPIAAPPVVANTGAAVPANPDPANLPRLVCTSTTPSVTFATAFSVFF